MYIHVNVRAGQKKEKVEMISDNRLKITVREPAERNLANKRIVQIIQSMHPKCSVRIINGYSSPSKLLSVDESLGD